MRRMADGMNGYNRDGKESVPFNLLDGNGINLLLAEDTLARICFLSSLIRSVEGGRVLYIDLDTVLTAYVMHGIMMNKDASMKMEMDIFIPDKGRFEDLLANVCSILDDDVRLVVLDSIHGFYHLYEGVKIASLNQLLISYISLLTMHTERYAIPFLLTSIRKRRVVEEQSTDKKKAYSTRYLWSKSSVILSAKYLRKNSTLLVDVIKHKIDGYSMQRWLMSVNLIY